MIVIKNYRVMLILIYFCLGNSIVNGRFYNRNANNDKDDSSLNQAEKVEVEALSHYGWGVYLSGADSIDWEKINEEYLTAIRKDPSSEFLIEDILRFWAIFDTDRESDQIIKYLEEIASDNPNAVELNLTVADAYIEHRGFDNAKNLLTHVFDRVKWSDPSVLQKLVQCYLGTGEIKKGVRLLRHATSPKRFRGDAYMEQSAAIFYNTVAQDYRSRISKNRRFEYQTFAYEHALKAADAFIIDESVEINPHTMELIGILLRGNFTEETISMLSSLRSKGKRHIDTDKLLAECYESKEEFDKALEIWKELSNQFPLNPFYHSRMGRIFKLQQRYEDALLAMKTAYWLVENPGIAFEVATLYLLTNQPRNALEYAEKASSNNLDTYLLIAYIYRDLNQLEQSLVVLENAQQVARNRADNAFLTIDYYLTLANLYYTLNRKKEIVQTLEKALKIYPSSPDANNFLGYFLADENKDLSRAKKLIRKAIEINPDNPAYLDSLAWVLYRQGQYRAAASTIKQAIKLQSSEIDGLILDHAGDIHFALHDFETAVDLWKKALKQGVENSDEIKQKIKNGESKIND